MTHHFRRPPRQCEGGAVAIEAAVCINFVLIPILAFVLLFGRYFWYYTVAQKAAHDAAVYMAGVPVSEIKSGRGAAGLAADIISWETGDLDTDTTMTMGTTVLCGYKLGFSTEPQFFSCNGTASPIAVRTGVTMTVSDPFLSPITNALVGTDGLPIFVGVTMNYAGH